MRRQAGAEEHPMEAALTRTIEQAVERQKARLARSAGPPPGPPDPFHPAAAEARVEARERARQRYRGGKLAALLAGGSGRGGSRPSITPRQFEAAQLWRQDFEGGSGLRAADLDRTSGASAPGSGMHLGGLAGATFARAWAHLGSGLARVAFQVAVCDRDPAELARAREAYYGRPVRTDMVMEVLRYALDELASFYRVPDDGGADAGAQEG